MDNVRRMFLRLFFELVKMTMLVALWLILIPATPYDVGNNDVATYNLVSVSFVWLFHSLATAADNED